MNSRACWSLLNCIQHLYYGSLAPYMQAIPYYGLQFRDAKLVPYVYTILWCQFIVSLCQFSRLRQSNISFISIQNCHHFSVCACFSCKQKKIKYYLNKSIFRNTSVLLNLTCIPDIWPLDIWIWDQRKQDYDFWADAELFDIVCRGKAPGRACTDPEWNLRPWWRAYQRRKSQMSTCACSSNHEQSLEASPAS